MKKTLNGGKPKTTDPDYRRKLKAWHKLKDIDALEHLKKSYGERKQEAVELGRYDYGAKTEGYIETKYLVSEKPMVDLVDAYKVIIRFLVVIAAVLAVIAGILVVIVGKL